MVFQKCCIPIKAHNFESHIVREIQTAFGYKKTVLGPADDAVWGECPSLCGCGMQYMHIKVGRYLGSLHENV